MYGALLSSLIIILNGTKQFSSFLCQPWVFVETISWSKLQLLQAVSTLTVVMCFNVFKGRCPWWPTACPQHATSATTTATTVFSPASPGSDTAARTKRWKSFRWWWGRAYRNSSCWYKYAGTWAAHRQFLLFHVLIAREITNDDIPSLSCISIQTVELLELCCFC